MFVFGFGSDLGSVSRSISDSNSVAAWGSNANSDSVLNSVSVSESVFCFDRFLYWSRFRIEFYWLRIWVRFRFGFRFGSDSVSELV